MPNGYWIGRIDVIKPEYTKAYGPALAAVLRKYDAKFRVRGGTFEAVEGKARDRNIVIEFKDYETALACYRSPEYTKARALRAGAVDIDIIVIEGYDGPQPTARSPRIEPRFGGAHHAGRPPQSAVSFIPRRCADRVLRDADLVINGLTMRAIILAAAPASDTLSGMESGFGQQQRLGSTTSDSGRSGRRSACYETL